MRPSDTAGSSSLYLDGSDHGLTTRRERIDAITFDGGGRLVVSTIGPARVPSATGPLRIRDEDLIALDNAGDWELLFDGSDVALRAKSEDVWGTALDPASGELLLTTQGDYSVAAMSGDRDDVIAFTGVLGPSTSGTFTLFFDGDVEGLGDERIDAVSLDP